MLAAPGSHGHAPSGVLQGSQQVSQTKLHDKNEAEDRYTGGPTAVQSTIGYRRTGVWEHHQLHRIKALQSTRQD